MTEKGNPIILDDLFTATANGVLRAMEARQAGAAKTSTVDFIRSGFYVNIHIVAGGLGGPFYGQFGDIPRLAGGAGPALPSAGGTG